MPEKPTEPLDYATPQEREPWRPTVGDGLLLVALLTSPPMYCFGVINVVRLIGGPLPWAIPIAMPMIFGGFALTSFVTAATVAVNRHSGWPQAILAGILFVVNSIFAFWLFTEMMASV